MICSAFVTASRYVGPSESKTGKHGRHPYVFYSIPFVVPKTTAGASRAISLTTGKMLFVAKTILSKATMNLLALDTMFSVVETLVSTTDKIASMTVSFSQSRRLQYSKRYIALSLQMDCLAHYKDLFDL
jgi:hypothetical protein